jgi:hypothetical protein
VVVVTHQAVRVDDPAEPSDHPLQEAKEDKPVFVVEEDKLLVVAPHDQVEGHTGSVDP